LRRSNQNVLSLRNTGQPIRYFKEHRMLTYYWELDFSENSYKYPAMWIGQTITASDGGLMYEAEKNSEYSWQDTYGFSGLTRVQSREDAIERLKAHRQEVLDRLAHIDAVLEAAEQTTIFVDLTDYDFDADGS
jgi:hypothetical protein